MEVWIWTELLSKVPTMKINIQENINDDTVFNLLK